LSISSIKFSPNDPFFGRALEIISSVLVSQQIQSKAQYQTHSIFANTSSSHFSQKKKPNFTSLSPMTQCRINFQDKSITYITHKSRFSLQLKYPFTFFLFYLLAANQREPKFRSIYLPRAHALEGGQVPDPNLETFAGGEEQLVVRAKRQGRRGVRVCVNRGPYRGVGRIDDSNRLVARARDERAVRCHRKGPARVELLQRRHAAVVFLQR
jgi:hypothetical protein